MTGFLLCMKVDYMWSKEVYIIYLVTFSPVTQIV